MAISRQLEHDWHRLKPQTKHLVHDLRTLRTLFQYLIQYDCISFWKLINSIKTMSATARYPSMWLLTPAAEMIFQKAKERIYVITRGKPTSKVPNPVSKLLPKLEENPKWKLLRQILTEIQADWTKRKKYKDEQREKGIKNIYDYGGARVLVMVKDDRTLDTIKSSDPFWSFELCVRLLGRKPGLVYARDHWHDTMVASLDIHWSRSRGSP